MTEQDVLELEGGLQEPTTEAENTVPAVEENSELAEETTQSEPYTEEDSVDYESLMREDLAELKREFYELDGIESITELSNPLRYAALRDLGLSPKEAYLATSTRKQTVDNRSHLSTAVGRTASRPKTSIPPAQLRMARELFSDLSDAEINALYRRVSK